MLLFSSSSKKSASSSFNCRPLSDANKGFYVGSAVISAMVPASSQNLTAVSRQTGSYLETLRSAEGQ
jgi:hypothetical protein